MTGSTSIKLPMPSRRNRTVNSISLKCSTILRKDILYYENTSKSRILRATLDFNGSQYNLYNNSFSGQILGNDKCKVRMHHSFYYFDKTNTTVYGSWYSTLGIDRFRTMTEPLFIEKIVGYQLDNHMGDAVVTIEFEKEALDEIHEFAYS